MEENREEEVSLSRGNKGGRRGSASRKSPKGKWKAGAKEWEQRVRELEKEIGETRDKYLRALADLDNLRKRSERERADLIKSAGERLIANLLEVLDGFDQALALDSPAREATGEGFVDGIRLLRDRLLGVLEKEGLTPIDSEGKPFDPNMHEAVMQVETDQFSSDMVVQEVRKGYLLHDRLLRPARVTVSK